MIKDEILSRLFYEYTGSSPESLTVLPKSGSDRLYCRMVKGNLSVLGAWNPVRNENDAFTGFARHFRDNGLRVPEILSYLPEEMVFLIEDLGETDLCLWVKNKYEENNGHKAIGEMYRNILGELVRFQFDAGASVNFNLAYPRKAFDRSSVMWDLNYFKYMFLKLSGTGFNEQYLEDEFIKLADGIENVKLQGFMYRDFQSRNVMIRGDDPWFIDFQGGRKGAPHYDVASLLLDPYVELNKSLHDSLLDYYIMLLEERTHCNYEEFVINYPVFAIVRLLQALGAYGFRGLYERKPNFIESIPPAIRQLNMIFKENQLYSQYPELGSISGKLLAKWENKAHDAKPG
jgi:aminoglycoside/choline kinase family phosphotransferase